MGRAAWNEERYWVVLLLVDRRLVRVIVMWDQYFVVITILVICYALCNCKSIVLP